MLWSVSTSSGILLGEVGEVGEVGAAARGVAGSAAGSGGTRLLSMLDTRRTVTGLELTADRSSR